MVCREILQRVCWFSSQLIETNREGVISIYKVYYKKIRYIYKKHSKMNETIIYFLMAEVTRLWNLVKEKDKIIEALEKELDLITDPLIINDIQTPN